MIVILYAVGFLAVVFLIAWAWVAFDARNPVPPGKTPADTPDEDSQLHRMGGIGASNNIDGGGFGGGGMT